MHPKRFGAAVTARCNRPVNCSRLARTVTPSPSGTGPRICWANAAACSLGRLRARRQKSSTARRSTHPWLSAHSARWATPPGASATPTRSWQDWMPHPVNACSSVATADLVRARHRRRPVIDSSSTPATPWWARSFCPAAIARSRTMPSMAASVKRDSTIVASTRRAGADLAPTCRPQRRGAACKALQRSQGRARPRARAAPARSDPPQPSAPRGYPGQRRPHGHDTPAPPSAGQQGPAHRRSVIHQHTD